MSDFIQGMKLPDFLARRHHVLDGYRRAFEALLEAESVAKDSGFSQVNLAGYPTHLDSRELWGRALRALKNGEQEKAMGEIERYLDALCWRELLAQAGLWGRMDEGRHQQWLASLARARTNGYERPDALALPPMNLEAVSTTLLDLNSKRQAMEEETVQGWLESISFCPVENKHALLERRTKIRDALVDQKYLTGWYPGRAFNRVVSLVNALEWLDGKGKHYWRADHWRSGVITDDTREPWHPYFEFRRFKNGNACIVFHKHAEGLMGQLNARIAQLVPEALPAPR